MGAFVNRVGEVHNNIEIIEEIGNGWVKAKCLCCGQSDKFVKHALIMNISHCKNPQCINYKISQFKSHIGEIHNTLEIVEDSGGGVVTCQCVKCKQIYRLSKQFVLEDKARCKSCELRPNIQSHLGEIHRGLKIIQETGNKRVICRCENCGFEAEYIKQNIIRDRVVCKNCGVPNTTAINSVGKTFNNLQVLEELPEGKVKCKCIDCGAIGIYSKPTVTFSKVSCNACNIIDKYRNKQIREVVISKFAYTGRNKKRYYVCKCAICGEELPPMSREDMLEYRCQHE